MSSKQLGTLLTIVDGIAIVATGLGVMMLHPILQTTVDRKYCTTVSGNWAYFGGARAHFFTAGCIVLCFEGIY